MATLPGFFSVVKLGKSVVTDPGDRIDVSDLNFAIVMHEDDEPTPYRYTTWGMQADSATLYQTLSDNNKIIVGDHGIIYSLSESVHQDDGVDIPLLWESGPLPEASAEELVTMPRRLHSIALQIGTPPPATGFNAAVRVIDMDNSKNFVQLPLFQTETKVLLPITITARQFRIRLTVRVGQDFDPVSFSYTYQTLNRPYWRR